MGGYIALSLLLVLLAIVAGVLASEIRMELRFRRARDNDRLEVDVRAVFGLVHYHYEASKIDFQGMLNGIRLFGQEKRIAKPKEAADIKDLNKQDIESGKRILNSFRKHFRDYNGWLSDTLAKLTCTGFRWSTSIGVKSPNQTAVLTGAGWAIKSILLGKMSEKLKFRSEPILLVTPCYNRYAFSTDLEVRLQVRAGEMAVSGWQLFRRMNSLGHAKQALKNMRRVSQAKQRADAPASR